MRTPLPYELRNEAKARDAAARDWLIANEIISDPPDVPQGWLDVCIERAGNKLTSWPDIAAHLGITMGQCYGRWRRLMEATGHRRPRPSRRRELEYPDPLPQPEHGEPEWLTEYRQFVASDDGYSPSRGTARWPDEVAS